MTTRASESTDESSPRGGFPPIRAWHGANLNNPSEGAEYGDMISALRDFLDVVTAAAPEADTTVELTQDLRAWTSRLADVAVSERRQLWARQLDLPGHGQTMAPPFTVTAGDHDSVRGTVLFGRYFLGGGGAAHGGAVPLLFDEVLGQLANSGDREPSRTAYLHTDYRSITPIGKELQVHGWVVSEVGRKRILRAELKDGDTVCAEAEGLFVVLRPDQP